MRINGRGQFSGQWQHVGPDGSAVLRVEQAGNDAFWLEVVLSAEDVASLLDRMHAAVELRVEDETCDLDASPTDAEADLAYDKWMAEGGAS